MKFAAALSALALVHAAVAQTIQSKPFELMIQSSNKAIHGKKLLASCHEGAAIESLCVTGGDSSRYFLNTTKGSSPVKGYTTSGLLVWNLPVGNEPQADSEPMSFYVDPGTNVALPLFEPSYESQYVAFEEGTGAMVIFSYLDDTVTPPTDTKVKVLKNWYACEYNYSGYVYHTLNFVLGDATAKPQNPSCVKVQVHRKFV
ncbi:uncharacterized protein PFLUO_LOCUS2642 [Penicillium psychrofluorescens]|uniref:uncharacterized protein n=1 Tax=Penicillium psychrofluorescens TaxID=3158075 RepID=UPI003CCD0164